METTKTTEKFKSVHQTFSYTPPSAWTNQWSSLAFGIGMIVVPLIYPFGYVSGGRSSSLQQSFPRF